MNDVRRTFSLIRRFMHRGTYPRMLFMLVSRAFILYGAGAVSAPVILMLLYGALTSGSAMRVAALGALWLVYAYWMVAGDRRNMVEYNRIYFCNQVSMQTHYLRCALGLKLPAYDEKYRQGMLIELIDSGIDSVMMRFQDFFSMLVKGVAVLAICALIGIAGSLRLSVAFFALAGVQILLCALIDRRMKDVSRKLTDLQAAYTGGVQALFASYESYTCAGLHGLWFDKIARISDERVREKRRMDHLTALQAFICGMMSIVTYGAILAFALSNSGDVVALMALPIGYQALNDALTDFVRALSSIRSESHLADRLDELESAQTAKAAPAAAACGGSGIQVRHLSVTLGDKAILKDVSLNVNSGEHMLLLGGNGSGKSTLLRALAGLIEPAAGEVCLDGKSTGAMPQAQRYKEYAYVPAQGALLPVSCAENLSLVCGDLAQAREMARRLGLDIDLEKVMPDALSLGQQQRLEVCRALCSDAPWLILDEPTAHLDRDTARRVWDEVFASRKGAIATVHEYEDVLQRYAPRVESIPQRK